MTFFDTADMNDGGVSEEVTGRLLSRLFAHTVRAGSDPVLAAHYEDADFDVVDVVRAVAALALRLGDDEIARLEAPYRPHPVIGHS